MSSNGGDRASGARAGLSLYASLLEQGSSGSTISAAPVKYNQSSGQDENANKQQSNAAALRFQPSKRPLASTLKPKPKSASVISKPPVPATANNKATDDNASTPNSDSWNGNSRNGNFSADKPVADEQVRSESYRPTLQDWADDDAEDAGEYYRAQRQQRGGRKKRKKQQDSAPKVVDWDAIYDPTMPNSYEDYKHSEEKYNEIIDWKRKLRRALRQREDSSSSTGAPRHATNPAFAPPSNYNFAPPTSFDDDDDSMNSKQRHDTTFATPPAPAVDISTDTTGEDAYTRRMRLSGMASIPSDTTTTGQPPTVVQTPQVPAGTISRAPVRYTLPEAPAELPTAGEVAEAEAADVDTPMEDADVEAAASGGAEPEAQVNTRSSTRPGQKGFAERLLNKYGWTKGSGLGANATGIVKPLQVKVDKRQKRSDAEGGGFIGPAGKGKIIGGSKSKAVREAERQAEEKHGALSAVVRLEGMVKGVDLERELTEGSLMQDIGDECGSKYGRVERVFVDRASGDREGGAVVFVKFTAELSALRAVQALDGSTFNGNPVKARYFDVDRFEKGDYDPE